MLLSVFSDECIPRQKWGIGWIRIYYRAYEKSFQLEPALECCSRGRADEDSALARRVGNNDAGAVLQKSYTKYDIVFSHNQIL